MSTTYEIPKALVLTPKITCASGVVSKNPEVQTLLGPASTSATRLLALVQDSQRMPLIPRGNCALAFSAYIKVAEDVLEEKSIPSALDACDVPAVELLAASPVRLRSWHLCVCSTARSHKEVQTDAPSSRLRRWRRLQIFIGACTGWRSSSAILKTATSSSCILGRLVRTCAASAKHECPLRQSAGWLAVSCVAATRKTRWGSHVSRGKSCGCSCSGAFLAPATKEARSTA